MFEKARAGMKFRAQVARKDWETLQGSLGSMREGWGEVREARREVAALKAQGPTQADKISVGMTYVCFFLGALVGAHRIWMGRSIRSTLLYVLTGNYLMLGWLWDLCTIPVQVRRVNYKIDLAIAQRGAEIAAIEARQRGGWGR